MWELYRTRDRLENPAYDNSWIITSRKEEFKYSYIFHSFLRDTGSIRSSEHICTYVVTHFVFHEEHVFNVAEKKLLSDTINL